jgi:hypothetical protein
VSNDSINKKCLTEHDLQYLDFSAKCCSRSSVCFIASRTLKSGSFTGSKCLEEQVDEQTPDFLFCGIVLGNTIVLGKRLINTIKNNIKHVIDIHKKRICYKLT